MYSSTTRNLKSPANLSITLYHSAERLLQSVTAIDTPSARYCAQAIRNVLSGDICSYSDAMDVLHAARLTLESRTMDSRF